MLVFVIAPEAFYERSWSGLCYLSTFLYTSISFNKKLDLQLAPIVY